MVVPKMRLSLLAVLAIASSACTSSQYGTPGTDVPAPEETSVTSTEDQAGFTARAALTDAAQGGDAGTAISRQMDAQAAELKSTMIQGATVERVAEGIQVTIAAGLLYGWESSDLREGEATEYLQHLAAILMKYTDTELLIVGHTDDSGGNRYTQALSLRRADATVESWRIRV